MTEALPAIKNEPDYEMFLTLLKEGHTSMTRMAEIIFKEYDRVNPGAIKSAAVMRVRLYLFAKRESFVKDKEEALRGLRPLHSWQIYNANLKEAKKGTHANIKFFAQKEEGWSEKAEIKGDLTVNADGIVGGVIEAMRKVNDGNQ